jgi:hypothetical protein
LNEGGCPKNRRKANATLLRAILAETPGTRADRRYRVAFVEQVSSRPVEGVSSAFFIGIAGLIRAGKIK